MERRDSGTTEEDVVRAAGSPLSGVLRYFSLWLFLNLFKFSLPLCHTLSSAAVDWRLLVSVIAFVGITLRPLEDARSIAKQLWHKKYEVALSLCSVRNHFSAFDFFLIHFFRF